MSDYDIEQLESQEWTLGGEERQEVIEFGGMELLVQDPGDDEILNMMIGGQDGDNAGNRLYEMVSSAVVAPEVTLERWRDMRSTKRIALAMQISEAIGLDELMSFREDGLEAQLDD